MQSSLCILWWLTTEEAEKKLPCSSHLPALAQCFLPTEGSSGFRLPALLPRQGPGHSRVGCCCGPQMWPCSWNFGYFGFFPSSTFSISLPPFHPPNSRWDRQKERRKGASRSLDYFVLIRGINFLRASLVFAIRISHFFLSTLHIQLLDKPQPTATFYWGSSIYILSEESPELQMLHTHRNYL